MLTRGIIHGKVCVESDVCDGHESEGDVKDGIHFNNAVTIYHLMCASYCTHDFV